MDDKKVFTIKITGDKFTHEQEVDAIQKAKIISFLMLPESNLFGQSNEAAQQLPDSPTPLSTSSAENVLDITPREYLNEKNPTTSAQKITTFAMFLREVRGQEEFTKEDVRQLFEDAREVLAVNNYSRDFNAAITNGWIFKKSNGQYYVTNTGETVVKNKFENLTKKPVHKSAHKNTGHKKTTVSVRGVITELELQPDAPGYRNYWKLNKGERILWLLAQAQAKSINDLNFKEISFLAEKVGDFIEAKQISSLTKSYIGKKVYPLNINNTKVLRIVPAGVLSIKEENNAAE